MTSYPYTINRDNVTALISAYEEFANAGRAQSIEAKWLMNIIKNWFDRRGLEFCSHNHAYYGSKRYAAYYNANVGRPVTKKEWKRLSGHEILNFEKLTDLSFLDIIVTA